MKGPSSKGAGQQPEGHVRGGSWDHPRHELAIQQGYHSCYAPRKNTLECGRKSRCRARAAAARPKLEPDTADGNLKRDGAPAREQTVARATLAFHEMAVGHGIVRFIGVGAAEHNPAASWRHASPQGVYGSSCDRHRRHHGWLSTENSDDSAPDARARRPGSWNQASHGCQVEGPGARSFLYPPDPVLPLLLVPQRAARRHHDRDACDNSCLPGLSDAVQGQGSTA